jgi:hypothetical protein
VEAKVVHFNAAGVEMEAFNGDTSIGSKAAGLEQGQIHPLVIELDFCQTDSRKSS